MRDGLLMEINKKDFKNDYLFYRNIIEWKPYFSKLNSFDKSNYSNFLISKILVK
jgi:hypothetical protein